MKRCLVADQSEIIRKVARHYLEKLSFEVLEADAADPALAMCREKPIDAVILDARLPGKTTVEFLSALRFSGNIRRPLIIYTTTENDPSDISRAFGAGADTYMMKPFDQSSFIETLNNAGLSN
jgi:two-component system chemotaxis response regulator CheY